MSTIAERVAAGVALLDREQPDWWKTHYIDLSRFEMSSGCYCVLGQVYPKVALDDDCDLFDINGFDAAIRSHWLDLTYAAAVRLGFYAPGGLGAIGWYEELQAEWTRVITERRAAA